MLSEYPLVGTSNVLVLRLTASCTPHLAVRCLLARETIGGNAGAPRSSITLLYSALSGWRRGADVGDRCCVCVHRIYGSLEGGAVVGPAVQPDLLCCNSLVAMLPEPAAALYRRCVSAWTTLSKGT